MIAGEPSDGGDLVAGRQGFANLVQCQLRGIEPLGIDDHRYFALIGRRDIYPADSGDAREQRPQIEPGDVSEIDGRQLSGEVEAENREHRRGHPLDDNVGLRRQRLTRFVHPPLHQLQGLLHVGVGTEETESSVAPRIVFERTRRVPSTPRAASSSGRVTPTVIICGDRSPECAMTAMRGNSASG